MSFVKNGESVFQYLSALEDRIQALEKLSDPFTGVAAFCLGAGASFTSIGAAVPSVFGTVAHPGISAGSLQSSTSRATITSAATANTSVELRNSSFMVWRGNTPNLGGFLSVFRFGCASDVSTSRLIVGWLNSISLISSSQDPSALISCFFVGNSAGQTTLRVMCNDTDDLCSEIDLGPNFPVPTLANGLLYEVVFSAPANGQVVNYHVKNLNTGVVATGILSANLPASTAFLAPHMYMNNGGTAAAVSLVFTKFYKETNT